MKRLFDLFLPKRIYIKAEILIYRLKVSKGNSQEDPYNSATWVCRKLLSRNWKQKWADWFYEVGEERNWSDKDIKNVWGYIEKKYKKELINERNSFQRLHK